MVQLLPLTYEIKLVHSDVAEASNIFVNAIVNSVKILNIRSNHLLSLWKNN